MENEKNPYTCLLNNDLEDIKINKKAKKIIRLISEKKNPEEQSCCISKIFLSWIRPVAS